MTARLSKHAAACGLQWPPAPLPPHLACAKHNEVARARALAWLGHRYLLAEPQPRIRPMGTR